MVYHWNYVVPDELKEPEWWAIGAKKKFDDIFSYFNTMHECDGRTYGGTAADGLYRAYV